MSSLPDFPTNATTGERIQIIRERKGLSRPVLAGLVGRSASWLKKIETGERELRSITHLVHIANALHVPDVSILTGDAVTLPVDGVGKVSHVSVPGIRTAMRTVTFTLADGPPTSPEELRGRVDQAWMLWHTSEHQRTEVGALLPALIRDAHTCVSSNGGQARRRAHAATSDLYRLVQRHLAHISEAELYWTAVDRGTFHAEEADDPLTLALAAWSTAIGQRATGFPEDAVRTDEAGMALLRDRLEGEAPEVLGIFGALHLQAATSYGLDGRKGDAERHLRAADKVAKKLPSRYAHPQTAFSRENVAIHGVSVSVGLVTPGEALRHAEDLEPATVASLERRSRLLIDIAAGHHRRREPASAVHYLGRAADVSLEAVRYVPFARGLAVDLTRAARGPLKADAVQLAERIGLGPS